MERDSIESRDFKEEEVKKPKSRKRKIQGRRLRKRYGYRPQADQKQREAAYKTVEQEVTGEKTAEPFTKEEPLKIAATKTKDRKTLQKKRYKLEKAREKVRKAENKLPKQTEYRLDKKENALTGEVYYELTLNRRHKKPKKWRLRNVYNSFREGKEFLQKDEERDDNAALDAAEAVHKKADQAYDFIIDRKDRLTERKYMELKKAENKEFKAAADYKYNEFLSDNPQYKHKPLKKMIQKSRIKREYAKALRGNGGAKGAAYAKEAVASTTKTVAAVAARVRDFIIAHAPVFGWIALIALVLILLVGVISSATTLLGSGVSAVITGTFQTLPKELDKSDLYMTDLEMNLQEKVDHTETDYPGYDEYSYNLDEIGHDPFSLIRFLSAYLVEYTAADAKSITDSIFDQMYELTHEARQEVRTRMVTKTRPVIDPVTGLETGEEEEYEEEEEYTVKILETTLTSKSLEEVIMPYLSGDALKLYQIYGETGGGIQRFFSPLDLDWKAMVSSYYGYRKNAHTGERQLHRGLDIAAPLNTPVYAAQSGKVTAAGYDSEYGYFITIEDDTGYLTKYAHLGSYSVSHGQEIKHGDLIGRTGSTQTPTGSHLHIECMYKGEYYNPLFYMENGTGSIYGTASPESTSGGAAIIAEAERYLGLPYVWGGSSPSTGFDCSGYVSWVLKNSGVYDTPRLTAQGLYDHCIPVSASNARPGDLIFFTGTYNSAGPVSHVGIYAGNGKMIHCGDPIKYSSVTSAYWQSHFYSYGRII